MTDAPGEAWALSRAGNATVTVNGARIGTLTGGQFAALETDIPLGEHDLVIHAPGRTYRQRLSFDEHSDGIDPIALPRSGPRGGSRWQLVEAVVPRSTTGEDTPAARKSLK